MSRIQKKLMSVFLLSFSIFPFLTSCQSWFSNQAKEVNETILQTGFSPAAYWCRMHKKVFLQSPYVEMIPFKNALGLQLNWEKSDGDLVPVVKRVFLNQEVFKIKNSRSGEVYTGTASHLKHDLEKTFQKETPGKQGTLVQKKYAVSISCNVDTPIAGYQYQTEWLISLEYRVSPEGIKVLHFEIDPRE